MVVDKREILAELSFGQRVAEDELEELVSYFVETDQWARLRSGQIDVVFGPKGSGKSALYSALMARTSEFLETEAVLLIGAEQPQGTPAFRGLVTDPPTSETEFVSLWKLYLLSLIGTALVERSITTFDAMQIRDVLANEGLLPKAGASLSARVKSVVDYARRMVKPASVEATMHVDAAGTPTAFGTKISLGEPSAEQRDAGVESIDSLLDLADRVLREEKLGVWILFDRLDVAFSLSRELEANALRALFKTYLDLMSASNIRLKIFLRTDIWKAIAEGGLREASHITRTLTISWSESTLLSLIVRRLVKNPTLLEFKGVSAEQVLASAESQRAFFDSLVPEQVDVGNNPRTLGWIVGRVKDGSGTVAPREVIHLLNEARVAQLGMLERGEEVPPNGEILSRQALREALPPVSRARLEQTIFAEYPDLRDSLLALTQEKTEQTPQSLSSIWQCSEEDARARADELAEVGVFERRGTKAQPRYWVPFLYRSGLDMVQGSA